MVAGRRPRVLYLQYTNPAAYPPLCHSASILSEAGFDVALLGIRGTDDGLEFERADHVEVALMASGASNWRRKVHYAQFSAWAMRWAHRWQPTWIYVSDYLAAPVGLALRSALRARTIYHEHDMPSRAASAFTRAALAARRRLAREADMCIVPNAGRAEILAHAVGRDDVQTIWNCPMRGEVASARVPAAGSLRVLYHGSLAPSRLPIAVLDAVARLRPRVSLAVAGYETVGHPEFLATLRARADALGIADLVHFIGTIPTRSELMVHCAAFDVGLAMLRADSNDVNECNMLGASNKPFDYLAGGLALLVADLPDWKAAYVDAGLGRSCDPASADSIAAALQWFCDHGDETARMGERGRRRIADEWNYERMFEPVLHRMTAA